MSRFLVAFAALLAFAGSSLAQTISVGPAPPGGSSLTLQYNNAGSFGGLSGSSVSGSNLTLGGTLTLGSNALILNGTSLISDSADVTALRDGTTAQALRVYNTFTDASNYERGIFDWALSANVLTVGTVNAGTGTARNMRFVIGGTNKLDYGVTISGTWTVGSDFALPSNKAFYWNSRSLIQSPSDGVIELANNAVTDFSRLQFGGTTASFPALKRSTTSLQVRLADDSAFAPIAASAYSAGATAGVTCAGAPTGAFAVTNGIITAC